MLKGPANIYLAAVVLMNKTRNEKGVCGRGEVLGGDEVGD
jgi:hypothetical protein